MKVAVIMLAVGLLLLATSFALPSVSDGRSGWTEEKAIRLQELGLETHLLAGKVGAAEQTGGTVYGPNAKDPDEFLRDRESLRSLEREAKELESELNGVRESPHQRAAVLKWAGVILASTGAVIAMRGQQ